MSTNNKCNSSSTTLGFEMPQLRSVAIRSNQSALLPLCSPQSKTSPTISANKINSQSSNPTSKDFLPPYSEWTIRDDSLPTLPFYYSLQKTHALISDVPPSVVASRISKCMKILSIAAVYDNDKAIARAETADHVRFTIQLYSCNSEQEENYGVIVELQRMSGSTFSFQKNFRAILRASKGIICEKPCIRTPRRFPEHLRMISTENEKASSQKMSDDVCHDITNAFEIAGSLLKKDRIDANLLGIESLCMLTDFSKTRHESAVHVAKMILSEDGEYNHIRDKVISLISYWRLDKKDFEEEQDIFDRRYFGIMHNHALAVLSNCLGLLASEGILSDVVICRSWFESELVSILIERLNESKAKPHDAYLAARCLHILVNASDKIRAMSVKLGVTSAMEISCVVG